MQTAQCVLLELSGLKMTSQDTTTTDIRFDAILAELERRFRKEGYGSKKAVLDKLELSESYLRMATSRRSLKLTVLMDLAKALGTSLPELTLAAERSQPDWRWEPPMGEVPPVVERTLLEALEQDLGQGAKPKDRIQGKLDPYEGPDLDDFNRLRLEDPQGCLENLLAFPTVHLSRTERIQYLTILGATFRRLVRLREANHALNAAMTLCRPEDPQSIPADILLKIAHLEYEYGRVYRALWLTERAIAWFELDQNDHGVGAALLDYAMWLHLDGQLVHAYAALQAAEGKIDPDNTDLRFMFYSGMATLLECRREPRRALRFQKMGRRLAGSVSKSMRPSLFISGGRLRLLVGERNAAVDEYLQACDAYLDVRRPISAALAAILAIEILVEQGDEAPAVAIALDMTRLVLPLAEESPLAEAAVIELITYARDGRGVPRECLQQVKQNLEGLDAELKADRRKIRRRPYVPKKT